MSVSLSSPTSLPLRLGASLSIVLCAACASTSSTQETSIQDELTLPGDRARSRMVEQPLGFFLRDINGDIRGWTQLTMTARSEEDRRKAELLEQTIARRSNERIDELIHELESGPRSHRVIAASALGFTGDEKALSPLLSALEDPDPEIQSNALLGLRLLNVEATPLTRICELMRYGEDSWIRSNAASCLSTLTNAGARADCVLECARYGLADPEPVVRSHSSLILATLVDASSIGEMADLLDDEVPLVRSAAMRSLAYVGTKDLTTKANAAKSLVGAYIRSSGKERWKYVQALQQISGRPYGDDEEEWTDWARRLQ